MLLKGNASFTSFHFCQCRFHSSDTFKMVIRYNARFPQLNQLLERNLGSVVENARREHVKVLNFL